MTKKEMKTVREIASNLPRFVASAPVYEVSDQGGNLLKKFSGTEDHDVNHARRIKRAYKRDGMRGVRSYLASVSQLIEKQNEIARLQNAEG
jgi:hypothetical protein